MRVKEGRERDECEGKKGDIVGREHKGREGGEEMSVRGRKGT